MPLPGFDASSAIIIGSSPTPVRRIVTVTNTAVNSAIISNGPPQHAGEYTSHFAFRVISMNDVSIISIIGKCLAIHNYIGNTGLVNTFSASALASNRHWRAI
jgi:hypothetical protein